MTTPSELRGLSEALAQAREVWNVASNCGDASRREWDIFKKAEQMFTQACVNEIRRQLSEGDREEQFFAWFIANYPPGTIISNPTWHAPRIFRAALSAQHQGGK